MSAQIDMVLNWSGELKRRAPAGKYHHSPVAAEIHDNGVTLSGLAG